MIAHGDNFFRMQVVVYSNIFKEKDREYIQELFNVLNEEGINAYVYEPYLQQYF